MTRFASIMGVAAVATLVLLSGCDTPMKTDYAKKLEGTWKSGELDRMLPGLNPADPMALTAVKTTVEVMIKAGDKANVGEFSLTVADTVAATMTPGPQVAVSGTIKVTSKVISVSVTGVNPPAAVDPTSPAGQLLAVEQDLNYELADNELTVHSAVLATLLTGATIMGQPVTAETKLTFTK